MKGVLRCLVLRSMRRVGFRGASSSCRLVQAAGFKDGSVQTLQLAMGDPAVGAYLAHAQQYYCWLWVC